MDNTKHKNVIIYVFLATFCSLFIFIYIAKEVINTIWELKCIEIIMTSSSPSSAVNKAKVLHILYPKYVTKEQVKILESLYE